MKRVVALVMTLCMLLSCVSVMAASKASENVTTTEQFAGEIVIKLPGDLDEAWKASGLSNYDGGSTKYTTSKGAEVVYKVTDIEAGNYEVYYWIIPVKQDSLQGFDVIINNNGKSHAVNVQTKIEDGEEVPAGWISVGVYDFVGNGEENIKGKCLGGNARATAVKLVPTDKELTKVDEKPAEEKKEEPTTDTTRVEGEGLPMEIEVEPQGRCIYAGPWAFSTAVLGPMNKAPNTLWVAANPNDDVYVTYHPEITSVGQVRISVFVPYWAKNQTSDIKYEVYHNGKMDEFHVNPASKTEAVWETLGTFEFNGSGDEYVKLVCTGVGDSIANTRASTVAFEVLNSATDGNSVWTTVYVTPTSDSESLLASAQASMASLDKFADMVGHWANYDVEYMANEGLVSGVSDNSFNPDANITRAEYITILDRAMGYELISGESYTDVPAGEWYATYVATAKANGLLEGLPTDDGFKPTQPITREEMALFTYNAIKATKKNDEWVKNMPDDFSKFTDAAEISEWAGNALKYLVQTGIIKGMTDTTVVPKGNATRAQGAVILKRFMQLFVWGGPPTDEEWVMTFSDEFFGDSLDWTIWDSEVGGGSHTLSSRWPENAVVKDGNLRLEIRKEKKAGFDNEWTAASVWVRPEVFRQSQGFWEARYKYNQGAGVNNAWWMMTKPNQVTDASQNYEIDINEGHYPHKINTNLHHYETGTGKSEAAVYKANYDLSQDYHTYAIKWDENEIIYYWDNTEIARNKNYNSIVPVSPWFSTAVLNWAGKADEQTDGSAMIVDYVHVYQRKDDVNNEALTMIGKPVEGATVPGGGQSSAGNSSTTGNKVISDLAMDNSVQDGEIIIVATAEDGDWKANSSLKNYNGKPAKWTNSSGTSVTYATGKIAPGKYKVYYWVIPNTKDGGQGFNVQVNASGAATDTVVITNKEADAGWLLVGEFEFKGTDDENVKGICIGGNTRSTAVKLVPVK